MNRLDPALLFEQIASDVPPDLHGNLFVTGSLAAAYHFRTQLQGQAINTKDADLVIHPAGHVSSCSEMTRQLLHSGWRPTDECYPQGEREPVDTLRAIRLFPPESSNYFIEFLNIPEHDQREPKRWIPMQLEDGWYGLPSFRFLGIVAVDRQTSDAGLEYAAVPQMALANLLSHPEVGTARIESGTMQGVLRSAKDLGRVIALAHLAGRDQAQAWREPWLRSVKTCFPEDHDDLLRTLGKGLEELLVDKNAMEDARKTTDVGLLNGMGIGVGELRATADRLLVDLIEPLRDEAVS